MTISSEPNALASCAARSSARLDGVGVVIAHNDLLHDPPQLATGAAGVGSSNPVGQSPSAGIVGVSSRKWIFSSSWTIAPEDEQQHGRGEHADADGEVRPGAVAVQVRRARADDQQERDEERHEPRDRYPDRARA